MKSRVLDALAANFSSDVMARFVMNLVKQWPDGISDVIFSEDLPSNTLEWAFMWRATPERAPYWNRIHQVLGEKGL